MNEVISYLNECGVFFISTIDDNKPKVRPFGFAMEYEGKVCICTSNTKKFFAQVKANPAVEICASKGAKWMRLSGDAVVCTTPESQAKALEIMPMLSGMYAVGDGSFEIIALDNGIADFNTMTGEHHQVTL